MFKDYFNDVSDVAPSRIEHVNSSLPKQLALPDISRKIQARPAPMHQPPVLSQYPLYTETGTIRQMSIHKSAPMDEEYPLMPAGSPAPADPLEYSQRTVNTVVKLIKRTGELHDTRVWAENIIEAALDAIITLDDAYCIVQYNGAAGKMFGYSAAQIKGKSFFDLLPPRYKDGSCLDLSAYIKPDKAEKGSLISLEGVRADGSEFPFEGSVAHAVMNKADYLSIIIRDTSDRLKAEKLQQELNLELMHQNERLQQFEYMASHNFRGPVATIMGLTQLLELNNTSSPQQLGQIVNYIKQTALQLDSIVRDIQQVLDHQHRADLVQEEVLLSEIINKITEDLAGAIATTKTSIVCKFDMECSLYGTRSSLYNIFYQLFSNAVKFRNPAVEPIISLEAQEHAGCLCITVKDNGLGLDLNRNAHKLFSPYSRFHTHVEGKGLGLHVVRTLLRQMGGEIKLDSTLNQGTTCTIIIPRHQ